MSTTVFRFLVILAACHAMAIPAFGQEERGKRDMENKNPPIHQRLAEEFPLILRDDRLNFELPDFEAAQQVAARIFPNNQGGGSSHRGNNQFSIDRTNGSANLVISNFENESNQFVFNDDQAEVKRVTLIRDGAISSVTQFFEKGKLLQCNHFDPPKNEFFVIRQDKDHIRVVFTEGTDLESVEVSRYSELSAHPRFETIKRTALSFGFRLPLAVSESENLAILSELLTFTQTNWDEFMQEFADLQSSRFAEREEATRKLIGSLAQWKIAIIWGLTNERVAKETKARLLAAIKASPESKAAIQINAAIKNRLMEDVSLMIKLLSTAEMTEEFRPRLVEKLCELSGERIDDDVEAWKKWSTENGPGKDAVKESGAPKKDEDKDTARSPSMKNRQIDRIREELASLLTIGVSDDGKLEVDRASWSRLFGDKSVKELVDHVHQEYEKSGLPKAWLELGGGYDISVANHSHLLFARLEEAIEKTEPKNDRMEQMRMMAQRSARINLGLSPKDLNRQIQSQKLSVAMRFHNNGRFGAEAAGKENFFQFSVVDTNEDTSRILFHQNPNGEFSLLLVGPRLDPIVILGQTRDKECRVNVLSRSDVFSAKAENAKDLFAKNESELKRLLFPILQENGINLNSTLGGPLEIKNEQGRTRKKKAEDEAP